MANKVGNGASTKIKMQKKRPRRAHAVLASCTLCARKSVSQRDSQI
jgi:hypothetical protein